MKEVVFCLLTRCEHNLRRICAFSPNIIGAKKITKPNECPNYKERTKESRAYQRLEEELEDLISNIVTRYQINEEQVRQWAREILEF